MSKKCRAYSKSKLGIEPPDNRRAFYAGWDAALMPETDGAEPDHFVDANNMVAAQIVPSAYSADSHQPVAWGLPRKDGTIIDCICPAEHARREGGYTVPLYAAPQPKAEQEPVASIYITPSGDREVDDWKHDLPTGRNLLYTAPQPRKRLTDPEIARMASGLEGCDGLPVNATKANWRKVFDFARAIEAAVWGDGK